MRSDFRQIAPQFNTLASKAMIQAEDEANGFFEGVSLFIDHLAAYQVCVSVYMYYMGLCTCTTCVCVHVLHGSVYMYYMCLCTCTTCVCVHVLHMSVYMY